jgi:hypothetical protein
MKTPKDTGPKPYEMKTSLAVFMASYNLGLPAGFPRPSVKVLKIFQAKHPMLFKNSDEWSLDRHRKRLMDWLISNNELCRTS